MLMDNQAYLDQISPVSKKTILGGDLFKSKVIKLILGGIAAVIAIIIFGTIINSGESEETKCIKLHLHTNNLSQIIEDFQPSVKSSSLRANSTSFDNILSNIEVVNENYLKENYDFKKSNIDKKLEEKEQNLYAELNNDLFTAKINGLLDRTYARKMAYEAAVLSSYIEEIYNKTKDEEYKSDLKSFLGSLEVLEETFDSFSETNPNEFKVTKTNQAVEEEDEEE